MTMFFKMLELMGQILTLQDPPLATEFLEVPCEVRTAEIEKIGGAHPSALAATTAASSHYIRHIGGTAQQPVHDNAQ